jgi:Rhs element Vgr protein
MSDSIDLLLITVLLKGKETSATVKSINVTKSINKISWAEVILNDGSKAAESFENSDSGNFDPGTAIEIKAGYESSEDTIFKGIIMSLSVIVDPEDGPTISIKCKDEAVKSTLERKNAYFLKSKDSDIISKVLGDYSFTSSVDSTTVQNEEVIQYGAYDWDFVLSRAEINGLVVITDDGSFNVKKPAVSGSTVATITYGDTLIDMNLGLNSNDQVQAVNAVSWDPDTQALVKGASEEPTVNAEGNIDGKKLSAVISANAQLQTNTPLKDNALKAWANAKLIKNRLSRFSGHVMCNGNAAIKPNTLVKLVGVSKALNGDLFVGSVHHVLEDGAWTTELGIGIDAQWFVEENNVDSLKAGGRLPAMNGLQIGVVKKIDSDPNEEFRVQVTLPLIQSSDDGIWARLSTFYASNGFGAFFYPEVGDEVILGFLDDHPSAPIILGSVYSKKNAPSQTPNEDNTHKNFLTKSKLEIDFNEEDKIITIQTPGKNIIVISDKDKGVTITDQNENQIKMDDSGVTIESKKAMTIKAADDLTISAKGITIKADQAVSMQGGTNVTVKASSALNLEGLNSTLKASASLTAQGEASAEFKASGNTTIKGAMVSIN